MSGFSAEWLALREPADAAARPEALLAGLRPAGTQAADASREVVDLGAGTGANLRYLAPRLGGRQRWRLVDADEALLAKAAAAAGAAPESPRFSFGGPGFDCAVECVRADLAADLEALPIPRGALVTASALLDLVSREWLERAAARCAAAGADVLLALTYDGRIELTPAERGDARVRDLVNRHQRRDKGFGRALGPAASDAARDVLAARGYALESARSDWRLGADAAALQAALLDGWLDAAAETAPDERTDLLDWHRRRRAHVDAGRSTIVVGHVDICGTLRGRARA